MVRNMQQVIAGLIDALYCSTALFSKNKVTPHKIVHQRIKISTSWGSPVECSRCSCMGDKLITTDGPNHHFLPTGQTAPTCPV